MIEALKNIGFIVTERLERKESKIPEEESKKMPKIGKIV